MAFSLSPTRIDTPPRLAIKASGSGDRIARLDADNAQMSWASLGKYEHQAKAYRESSPEYIAVSLIIRTCSLVGLNVLQLKGEQKTGIVNHPFELLMMHPNALQTKIEFLEYTIGFLALTGNAYWYLNGAPGEPTELVPLRSDRMRIAPGPTSRAPVQGYVYTVDHVDVPLEPYEVVHFKYFHPGDDYYGLSPLEPAALTVQTDISMQQWNRNFFGKDKAVPTGLVSIQTLVSDNEFKRIKEEWKANYGGVTRRTAIVRGADVKWQDIGSAHHDMEFMLGRQYNKEEIFQIYGIPPGLLDKTSTEANANAAMELFTGNTVWPLMMRIAEKVTHSVLPFYGQGLVCEPDDIRRKDAAAERAEIMAFSSFMTINEIRVKYLNLPPRDDGDLYAAGAGAAAITGQSVGFDKLPKDVRQIPADVSERQQLEAVGHKSITLKQREELEQFARYAAKGKDVDTFTFHTNPPAYITLAFKALVDALGPEAFAMRGILPASARVSVSGVRDPHGDEKEATGKALAAAFNVYLSGLKKDVIDGTRHVAQGKPASNVAYADYFDGKFWRAAAGECRSALYSAFYDALQSAVTDYGNHVEFTTGYSFDPARIGPAVRDATDEWAGEWLPKIMQTTRDGLGAILDRWESMSDGKPGDLIASVDQSPLFGSLRGESIGETENTRVWAQAVYIAATLAAGSVTKAAAPTMTDAQKVLPAHTGCVCFFDQPFVYDKQGRITGIDPVFNSLKDGHTICQTCQGRDGLRVSEIVEKGL